MTTGPLGSFPFEFAGTGVLPVGDGRSEIGSSMTLDGLRRLPPGAPAQLLFVDLADRGSPQAVLDQVGMELNTDYLGGPVGAAELLGIIIGGVALAIGLPLGVVAGRMAYNVYARRLGAPPEPATALWGLAGLVPVLLVTAYLVSLWPGWRASRVAAASVLRTE